MSQLPSLSDGRHVQKADHPRESFSNALARPAAERKIGIFRTPGRLLRCPTIRLKAFGVRKESWITLHQVLADKYKRTGRKGIVAERPGIGVTTGNDPNWRIETHRFAQHHSGVGHRFQMVNGWQSSLQDLVQLGVQFVFGLRVLRQEVPGPGERVSSGFMSGNQHGNDFIADLLVGESARARLLVTDLEKCRKEILRRRSGLATFPDHEINNVVKLSPSIVESPNPA